MARINLLPWRAERRKQRQREFFLQLGAAFVGAALLVILWSFWMGMRIDGQNERNTYLQGEIKRLDERIVKIKDLETVRQRLLVRKQIIEQLQASRSQMVHLFDELVRTIPTSARLSALKQSGDSLSLDGVAQSNASVAEYMRNIEASPWMGHADLRKTENSHDASRMPYAFGLDVALSRPKTDDAAAAPAASARRAADSSTAPAAASTAAARQLLTHAVKDVTTVPAKPTISAPVTDAATTKAPTAAGAAIEPTPATSGAGAKP